MEPGICLHRPHSAVGAQMRGHVAGMPDRVFPFGQTDIPKLVVRQLRHQLARLALPPDDEQQGARRLPGTEFLAQFIDRRR